jgi:prevent-host-death family protein
MSPEAAMLVNIYDAKTNLSALLDKAVAGEEVIIARSGKPLARLMPVTTVASKSGVRLGGLKRARLKLSADFHAPMTDEDLLGR